MSQGKVMLYIWYETAELCHVSSSRHFVALCIAHIVSKVTFNHPPSRHGMKWPREGVSEWYIGYIPGMKRLSCVRAKNGVHGSSLRHAVTFCIAHTVSKYICNHPTENNCPRRFKEGVSKWPAW